MSDLNIKEKLSRDEMKRLVELLNKEVPLEKYAKSIHDPTGTEMDSKEAMEKSQPKPSSCYEQFLDNMNCHIHVTNVLKQAQRSILKFNEPDLKVSSVCNKAYETYELCTFDAVPNSAKAERATLKDSTLQHFIQDLEYYHTSTLTPAEQVELSVKVMFDPSMNETFKEMKDLLKKVEE